MPKKSTTWVVVADGSSATIYATTGPGEGLRRTAALRSDAARKSTRALGTDRPGRTQSSAAGAARRAGLAPRADWHREAKREFLERVAAALDDGAKDKAFERLVLVANARALGDLRAALSARVAKRIVGELRKDLNKTPARELPEHLRKVMLV